HEHLIGALLWVIWDAGSLSAQNVIAVIWGFDNTLVQSYMQQPLVDRYVVGTSSQIWLRRVE
ncbi:MAG: hypothetical protein V3S71_00570, partial [Acidobacteriota bacterium]